MISDESPHDVAIHTAALTPVEEEPSPTPDSPTPDSPTPDSPTPAVRAWTAFRKWILKGGLHRAGANLVTVVVGCIAGYISWLHLYALGTAQPLTPGLTEEQEKLAASLTPFSIDGMILAGTLKLRQARIEDRPAHWAAYAAVILGVALTMAGNVASAPNGPDAVWARILAAAPPAAFLISVEVLAGRPLTMNLWDMIKMWYGRWRGSQSAAPTGSPATVASSPAISPEVPASEATTTGQPVAVYRPAPAPPVAGPAAAVPVTVTPTIRPAVRPAQERTERPRPPTRRTPAPNTTPPNTAARRDPRTVTPPKRDTRPSRTVDGVVLTGDALKNHARALIKARVAAGAPRPGLGAWVAQQYDPPMSERWGQERAGEVAGSGLDPAPTATAPEPDGEPERPEPEQPQPARYPVGPLPTREEAVPINSREHDPVGVSA